VLLARSKSGIFEDACIAANEIIINDAASSLDSFIDGFTVCTLSRITRPDIIAAGSGGCFFDSSSRNNPVAGETIYHSGREIAASPSRRGPKRLNIKISSSIPFRFIAYV